MRLIDAKAALEKIYLAGEAIKEYSGRFYEGKFNGLQCAYEIINDMSTVEERKHGHWIEKHLAGNTTITCSCCKTLVITNSTIFAYCPYCGAIMDGRKENSR